MRKLMWFGIGFAVSCGLGAYALSNWAWISLCAFLLCWAASRKWGILKPAGLITLGCVAGIVWSGMFSHFFLNQAKGVDGQTLDAQIQITDFSYETNYGCAADGMVTLDERTYAVRVYVNEDISLEPGDTVFGQFRFRYTPPGGMEEATSTALRAFLKVSTPVKPMYQPSSTSCRAISAEPE